MKSEKQPVQPVTSEPFLSRYLNSKGISLGLPISGTFELTARCNFNCRMCYVHLQNSAELIPRELTADQLLSLASDARDMGLIYLLLTGGEPFIREDFPYIYTELVKMGLVISINTNASLYNEEIRALFAKYPPSRINVTLYGGSEETYRSLCGNPSFEKVTANLRSMKEDGLQVRLNVSLTPYNVGDMEEIDRISRDMELQVKTSAYMYPPVRVTGEIGTNCARFTSCEAGSALSDWYKIHDPDDLFKARAKHILERKDAGVTDNCADVEQEGVRCRAGRSSFWLTWDGRLLPCGTMDIEASYPLRDGFAKAWDEVRERVAAIRLPMECSVCPDRMNCGVCASICKCEGGAFDKKPEYMCEMTKAFRGRMAEITKETENGQ